jgi:hypothetical protein
MPSTLWAILSSAVFPRSGSVLSLDYCGFESIVLICPGKTPVMHATDNDIQREDGIQETGHCPIRRADELTKKRGGDVQKDEQRRAPRRRTRGQAAARDGEKA